MDLRPLPVMVQPFPGRRPWSGVHVLLLVFVVLAILPTRTGAQAIQGVVMDDTNRTPVFGAMVRLMRGGEGIRGVETDRNGWFLVSVPGGGEYRLEASGLGYETALSQPLHVEVGDTVSVELWVRPDAVLLDPLTVLGRSRRGRDAFERRRIDWDRGIFLTPAMIDSISPDHPAEALKGLEKVDVRWGWGVSSTGRAGPLPTVRTVLGRGCMLYMVDFVPVQPPPWVHGDWSGSQLSSLEGKDLVAVEVYRSVLEVPPELRRYTDRFRPIWSERSMGVRYQEDIHCGLTVFWTRSGW
jgi:hypothetical protein